MIGYNLLLVVHVLSAAIWIGGGGVLSVIAARARGDVNAAAFFARLLPFVGIRVLMPAVILLPVTGVWMVLSDSEWSFEQTWVRAAIALFLVAFLVGAVYLSRVGITLDRTAGDGARAAALPALVNRWLAGYLVVLTVLIATVADMVFKPGAS